ncbi:MAG: HAMP domain-containing sensor histidine kinase [Erythrobacter sp.]|jgi:signal transduction histidine kinase|nr:HAMP domain-containing sensor histidine kinase [Erythrobacter sp.]
MERQASLLAARGLTDERDRLLTADDPLAELHEACGGIIPGVLAVPELLDLVRQARRMGLRIAREFSAYDGEDFVTGFARIHPLGEEQGGGCEVLVENWQRTAAPEPDARMLAERLDEIDRTSAEVTARLDPRQRIQLLTATAPDCRGLREANEAAPDSVWTELVTLKDLAHKQPLHWRLLDGARCTFAGSPREWTARLLPLGPANGAPRGFELLLVADRPLLEEPVDPRAAELEEDAHARLIGGALTPALRQPIARIIANAETIRSRLAGPLRDEYSEYAGNIVSAGQHLTGMLEDLAELEVVEAPGFVTQREPVDLADAARKAGGILGVRAQAKRIVMDLPGEEAGEDRGPIAAAEFRRVLQILINLMGNAIAYSPERSTVTLRTETDEDTGRVAVTVSDEGPGIDPDLRSRIFDKFERLGRETDDGSGLGLYISHRLARIMGGSLVLAGGSGKGATFRLELPRYTAPERATLKERA